MFFFSLLTIYKLRLKRLSKISSTLC